MNCTIFTTLKPGVGRTAKIQDNSIRNWESVFPGVKIIQFKEQHTPFHDMITNVEREVNAEILVYTNGDLLLADNFGDEIDKARLQGNFLMTGQRIDILEDGTKRLHRPSGMDYFVFRRGMFRDLPRVFIGRAYCDNALVAYCLRKGIPVIDASYALRVEHQFHDYGHIAGGRNTVWRGEEALSNKRENNLRDFGPNILDATHTLLPDGRIVPNIRKRPQCWGLWNLLTRGGKYWKNPKWPGVKHI